MWAPADLFNPVLDLFLLPMRRTASYFYEHLTVLALVVLGVAALITVLTILGDRRASGG